MTGLDSLGAVERVSTTEHVLRALREAIVTGVLPQGTQLREIPLSQQLGTGRSAVREALRQLVQEGLAQHEVHRGAFVRLITPEDIRDVYRSREAIETAAAELILEESDADLGPLRDAFTALEESAGVSGTWKSMADADISFHETLVALAGSPRLARMNATLAAESRMHLFAYPPYPAGRNIEDHRQILLALENGSREAVDVIREHLRVSTKIAIRERDT